MLVTHSLRFLPDVDVILVMKNGQISEMGTYEELVEKGGSFSEFIQTHVGEELDTGSTERNKQMLIQKTAYDTR